MEVGVQVRTMQKPHYPGTCMDLTNCFEVQINW